MFLQKSRGLAPGHQVLLEHKFDHGYGKFLWMYLKLTEQYIDAKTEKA